MRLRVGLWSLALPRPPVGAVGGDTHLLCALATLQVGAALTCFSPQVPTVEPGECALPSGNQEMLTFAQIAEDSQEFLCSS